MIGQNQETAQICITNLHPEKVVAFEKKKSPCMEFRRRYRWQGNKTTMKKSRSKKKG